MAPAFASDAHLDAPHNARVNNFDRPSTTRSLTSTEYTMGGSTWHNRSNNIWRTNPVFVNEGANELQSAGPVSTVWESPAHGSHRSSPKEEDRTPLNQTMNGALSSTPLGNRDMNGSRKNGSWELIQNPNLASASTVDSNLSPVRLRTQGILSGHSETKAASFNKSALFSGSAPDMEPSQGITTKQEGSQLRNGFTAFRGSGFAEFVPARFYNGLQANGQFVPNTQNASVMNSGRPNFGSFTPIYQDGLRTNDMYNLGATSQAGDFQLCPAQEANRARTTAPSVMPPDGLSDRYRRREGARNGSFNGSPEASGNLPGNGRAKNIPFSEHLHGTELRSFEASKFRHGSGNTDRFSQIPRLDTGAGEKGYPSHQSNGQPTYENQFAYQSNQNGFSVPKSSPSTTTNEYRSAVHTPQFSNSATPTTGPESRRSTSGSNHSTRPSNNQASLLAQGLQTLDAPQDNYFGRPRTQIPQLAYSVADYSITAPANRLNNYIDANTTDPTVVVPYSYSTVPVRHDHDPSRITRSALLEDFRTAGKNKHFELKDIYSCIVEFSGDQHGSRFIQQKLETANSDEKQQIFTEVLPDSGQLMVDVFGNYVIQKMFEHGSQSQKKVLASKMHGRVLSLSMQMYGCRVVQKALEHILTDQQASLVKELDGHVLRVVENQNGNHVIQKAIERVPGEHIQFIVDAHRGHINRLSKHTYGCRVIQRMLEYCSPSAKRLVLDELHQNISELIGDQFGNYVIQHVIAKGEDADRYRVVAIVQQQLLIYSKHKFASNVVEKAIEHADPTQREQMLQQLTGTNQHGESQVCNLLRDQYGNYVIQKCLDHLHGAARESLIEAMKQYLVSLRRMSAGKQVAALEKIVSDAEKQSGLTTGFQQMRLNGTEQRPPTDDLPHRMVPIAPRYFQQQHRS